MHSTKIQNQLLSKLPEQEHKRLFSHLEPVVLNVKQVIYEENAPIGYVYFPVSTVVSHIVTMGDGVVIEVSTTGSEGMVGISAFLQSERTRFSAFALVTGQGLRMSVADFHAQIRRSPALDTLLRRYTEVLLVEVAQGLACNQLHSVQQRCARWLLRMQDGVGKEEFDITQEFLCQLLGVRRATISEVASSLQRSDLIRYTRGKITILDRRGLEATACECYQVIRSQHERQSQLKYPLNGNHK